MGKFIELTVGETFGKLTVIGRAGKNKKGEILWKVVCNCPDKTEKLVTGSQLTKGHVKSCGCLKFIDLTGKTFGKLTVIDRARKDENGTLLWKTVCSCTNKTEKLVSTNHLTSGFVKSCGCIKSTDL